MPTIDLSILNQRQTPAFYADVFANRPAAGFIGRIFVSTNTFAFYRDNGTGWDLIGGPGTGTITGSGATGQIALWDGASTITGDTGLTYNGTDNSLTASKFIVTGGTSSQFLKADGSLDSSAYVTTNIYNGNGTLSGERTVSLNGNNLIFDGGASIARVRMDADTNVARIFSFATNNLPRWAFRIDGTESGSDAGSDFAIRRYNDAGTFVDAPLTVTRSTGQSTFAKKVVIENNAGDQQLQIVSTSAPSLRFDNLQTGATKRAGLGISTATNNFIQGSADRDFCIFNGSTAAASPILFGIYDAAAVNVQEAARISPARNFIVGTTTDNGEKFQVSGKSSFSNSIGIGGISLVNTLTTGNLDLNGGGGVFGYSNGAYITANLYYNSNFTFKSTANASLLNLTNGGMVLYAANTGGTAGSTATLTPTLTVLQTGAAQFSNTLRSLNIGINAPAGFISSTDALSINVTSEGYNHIRLIDRGITGNFCSLSYSASTGEFKIRQNDGGVGISFYTGTPTATERMRLDSASGNLLLNTTTDNGNKLQVNGDVYTNSKIKVGTSQISTNATTTAITTAKTIYTRVGNGKSEFVFVMGDVGGAAYFADIVSFASGASVVVISSTTTYGAPAARTYSVSGNDLQMSIASGTAETQVFPISGQ